MSFWLSCGRGCLLSEAKDGRGPSAFDSEAWVPPKLGQRPAQSKDGCSNERKKKTGRLQRTKSGVQLRGLIWRNVCRGSLPPLK